MRTGLLAAENCEQPQTKTRPAKTRLLSGILFYFLGEVSLRQQRWGETVETLDSSQSALFYFLGFSAPVTLLWGPKSVDTFFTGVAKQPRKTCWGRRATGSRMMPMTNRDHPP